MQPIIDFHTHIFPSNIAGKATTNVGKYYNINMAGNGTANMLLLEKSKNNVVGFVVHSSATKPDQVVNVNDFIIENVNAQSSFIGFGTLHYKFPDIHNEIDRIIKLGLKGIKLHPDFQKFDVDNPYMFPIYEEVQGKLPILIHAGDENSDNSAPRKIRRVMDMFPRLTVIAAHMGGYCAWEESEDYLCGTRAYFDTSSTFVKLPKEKIKHLINKHGIDKILFGSDYPYQLTSNAIEDIYSLNLTSEQMDKIFYKNAVNLLNI